MSDDVALPGAVRIAEEHPHFDVFARSVVPDMQDRASGTKRARALGHSSTRGTIVAQLEPRDISVEKALGRWHVEVRRLNEEEGGGWFAHFAAFARAVAHGDGTSIDAAIADATVSLNLMVRVLAEEGEALPPDDANRQPPTIWPDRPAITRNRCPAYIGTTGRHQSEPPADFIGISSTQRRRMRHASAKARMRRCRTSASSHGSSTWIPKTAVFSTPTVARSPSTPPNPTPRTSATTWHEPGAATISMTRSPTRKTTRTVPTRYSTRR